jgi:hypothetical protein
MGDINLTAGKTAKRPQLIVCGDVSENSTDLNKWEIIGVRTPDAALSTDMDTDVITDVLGDTYSNMGKAQLSMDFDPLPIVGGSKFQQKIYNLFFKQDWQGLANIRTLIIYAFAGTANTAMDAQLFPTSTIIPGDFGGEGDQDLNFAITVNFGGKMQLGKAKVEVSAESVRTITFTADTAAILYEAQNKKIVG